MSVSKGFFFFFQRWMKHSSSAFLPSPCRHPRRLHRRVPVEILFFVTSQYSGSVNDPLRCTNWRTDRQRGVHDAPRWCQTWETGGAFLLLLFCFLLLNTRQVEIVSNNCFSNKLPTEQRGERFHSEDLPVQSVICRHKWHPVTGVMLLCKGTHYCTTAHSFIAQNCFLSQLCCFFLKASWISFNVPTLKCNDLSL